MGNTAWITGRATTMPALTTLAQFSLLAFSCQALKITDNCSSGAQCSQELNGFRGAESVQNCQGAQCDIDFGRQPSQGTPQNNNQGKPQNSRPDSNQERPEYDYKEYQYPEYRDYSDYPDRPTNNNQPGRVTINDNCSSGAQCTQNLNGNVVDSTQNCRGAQCDVNFGGSGGGNNGRVGGDNNGFGGVPGGRIETVNCGQGVSRTSTSPDGVIQVICSNGNTKTANCPPGGQSVLSKDGFKVTIQCNGGAAFGGNQRRRGGGNPRRGGGGIGGGGGGGRGGGVTINRSCSGSRCSVSTSVGRQG